MKTKMTLILLVAAAAVFTQSQAGAAMYSVSGDGSSTYYGSTALITITGGSYDSVTGNGSWTEYVNLDDFPLPPAQSAANWTMDAATGTGTLYASYSCVSTSTISCSGFSTAEGPWTASPAPINGPGTYLFSFHGATYDVNWNVTLTEVPIPGASWLFGSGLLGLAGIARRKVSVKYHFV